MPETQSPLADMWEAISIGDVYRVNTLIENNPSQINGPIPFGGGTFLHLAASKGNVQIIDALLKAGFEVNKERTVAGDNALAVACANANGEAAKYLLDHGAKMDLSTSARNPLFAAIVGRSLAIVRLLLERGIDSTIQYTSATMSGMDAVAFALERGERDIAIAIAEWNARGDPVKVEVLLAQGMATALRNSDPAERID